MVNPFPKFHELHAAMVKLAAFMDQHRSPGTSGLPRDVEYSLRNAVALTLDLESMLDARAQKLSPLAAVLARSKRFARQEPRDAAEDLETAYAVLQIVEEAGEALNLVGIRRGMQLKVERFRGASSMLRMLRDAGLLMRPPGNTASWAPHSLTDEARQVLTQLKAALER